MFASVLRTQCWFPFPIPVKAPPPNRYLPRNAGWVRLLAEVVSINAVVSLRLRSYVMVTLELQLPSNRKDLPGSFRQIDPVAALQHLVESQRVSRLPKSLAVDSQEVDVGTSLQLVQNVTQASHRQNIKRGTKSQTLQATTPRGVQNSYSNDGVRLSDLGEQPLAVDSGCALDEQQELSFSLPDPGSPEGCHSRNHDVTAEQLYSKRRSYVCNTKDDPLVKGRLAPSAARQPQQPLPLVPSCSLLKTWLTCCGEDTVLWYTESWCLADSGQRYQTCSVKKGLLLYCSHRLTQACHSLSRTSSYNPSSQSCFRICRPFWRRSCRWLTGVLAHYG